MQGLGSGPSAHSVTQKRSPAPASLPARQPKRALAHSRCACAPATHLLHNMVELLARDADAPAGAVLHLQRAGLTLGVVGVLWLAVRCRGGCPGVESGSNCV